MGDAGPKTNPRKRGNSSPWMPRLRKRGEKLLHSKYIVILVIILTITDCALVIAELILDLYSVKKTLSATEGQTFKFIKSVRRRYPGEVTSADSVAEIYERLDHSTILWNTSYDYDLHHRAYQDRDLDWHSAGNHRGHGMAPNAMPSYQQTSDGKRNTENSFAQNLLLQNSTSSTSYSNRSRRSTQSNTASGYSKLFYYNNEIRTRKELRKALAKLTRRMRRFASHSTGRRKSSNNFTNLKGNKTHNDVDEDDEGKNSDDGEEEGESNTSQREILELISLHHQLSEYITMQLNESLRQGFDHSTQEAGTVSNDDSSIDNSRKSDTAKAQDFRSSERGDFVRTKSESYSSSVSGEDSREFPSRKFSGKRRTIRSSSTESRNGRHADEEKDDKFEEADMRRELHHSKEMEIAHKLHYASVCVVSILLIEVSMKMVCAGSHFLKRKIEVFDAVVIVTSVVVDLIFIKGLSEFAVDDSIFVLAFLLPWRVIRVVNSLVMAVIDHEHVKLRLLYSRKKKLDKTVENLRNEVDELKGMLQDVRQFCIKEGIEATRIDSILGKFAPRRRKDSKFYTLVKLVMSTASINNNDNDSVSSSSMENDIRHYATRDSVLNETTSNEGTITSLKQFLSVPFFSGESHSISDAESLGGDIPPHSPSILITSPASEEEENKGVFTFCDVDMENNDESLPQFDNCSKSPEASSDAATIGVSSNTTNANNTNGVSFIVGSQTSLNYGQNKDTLMSAVLPDSNGNLGDGFTSDSANSEGATGGGSPKRMASDSNRSTPQHQYGRYLTVPDSNFTSQTLAGSANFGTAGFSNSNINHSSSDCLANSIPKSISASGDRSSASTLQPLLPRGSSGFQMKRSVSDNMDIKTPSNCESDSHRHFGSPTPLRRVPEVRTQRKSYRRSRTGSEDSGGFFAMLHREPKKRSRHHSGEPETTKEMVKDDQPQRARSHSPSPSSALSVPGRNGGGKEVTCTSSRSMNDVSTAENPNANNLGRDGKILRRSCLSLNSEGRKRRGKSPHRVSFKVS